MNPLRWALLRARALFARRTLERDMKEELDAHLERAEERLMARGMSRADARSAARREFGNVASIEEDARDARGPRIVESMIGDVRFAFRYFARKPLTTFTMIVVLALGIGVNTTLFSVIQAFTMRPAPGVPKDDAVVRVWGFEQDKRGAQWRIREFSYPEIEALAGQRETFTAVAAWTPDVVALESVDGGIVRATGAEFITGNYWTTLGVRPVAGPGLPLTESAGLAAVISHSLSTDLFGSPASAIGEQVMVNELPVRVVGVAPPRFEGPVPDNGRPQIWFPMSARAEVTRASPQWFNQSRFHAFARLAPSATKEQATVIAREISSRFLPDSAAHTGVMRNAEVRSLRSPSPALAGEDAEQVVGVIAVSVVALLILLVACTNVSSLMVASAVGRRHEIAVRLSLGASRGRLLRQLLTESALLSVTGGLLGLLVCWWLTTLIARMENINIVPDLGTVMFTVAFAVGTGIIFGLSPALHATRTGTSSALRESGSGATGQSRLQRVFVITQIVFSQPLLVLIALVLASIVADGAELPKSVLTRVISARFRPINEGAEGQSQEAVRSLGQLVANQPDVEKVAPEPSAFAVVQLLAPSAVGDTTAMRANGVRVHVEGTSPGYFGLIDVPIVLGRDVAFSDTASDEYRVIIGSDVARTLFGEESPIGRTLTTADWGARESEAPMVVIGVFDAAYATTRGSGKRVYTARGQLWRKDGLLIRTRGPAMAYLPTLQKFVRSAAPSLPVTRLATLMDIEKTTRRQSMRMIAAAVAAGGLALLLASIGLFAVISLAVGQRRREIGIRIALGAEPLRVVKMFFLSGMRMSATGLLIGLPISVALTHIALLNGVLIGPEFNLPAVGIGIALIVVLVAATATWFPARRAATVDPALALRAE